MNKPQPETPALVAAWLVVAVALAGLAVSLDAPPWVPWAAGLLLAGVVAVRLTRHALDERALRREVARQAPERPVRPARTVADLVSETPPPVPPQQY